MVQKSPSSRRAWIEISFGSYLSQLFRSPSSRRAWIEIAPFLPFGLCICVALLAEGVDRNNFSTVPTTTATTSPSSRRAWIEI